jgi:hypothetical protein
MFNIYTLRFIRSDVVRSDVIGTVIIRSVGESDFPCLGFTKPLLTIRMLFEFGIELEDK